MERPENFKFIVIKNGQRGGALLIVLVLAAVFAIFSSIIPSIITRSLAVLSDEDTYLEAQFLATDVKELAKYIMLYEKIWYVKDPLQMTATRKANLQATWNQTFGEMNTSDPQLALVNACGGTDILATFVGDFKLKGDPVICPTYIRNAITTGRLLEDLVMENWVNSGTAKVLDANLAVANSTFPDSALRWRKVRAGVYVLTIKFSGSDPNWYSNSANFLRFNFNQRLFKHISAIQPEIEADYTLYTDSSGFAASSAERFLTVTARVKFKGMFRERTFTDSESMVLYIPTLKEFSIFMPYPEKADGTAASKFSEAVVIPKASNIRGRVYFNGDMDGEIDDLPIFHEAVYISGQVNVVCTSCTTTAEMSAKIQEKFLKGYIANFSSARYVLDGNCPKTFGSATASGVSIKNGTGLLCRQPDGSVYTIDNYIGAVNNSCAEAIVNVGSSGVISFDLTNVDAPVVGGDTLCQAQKFVEGGYKNVNVTGEYAFLLSPVKKIDITASSNIYGLIIGGHINATQAIEMYSMNALKEGLPGIGTKDVLLEVNSQANMANAGVSAPLTNFTLVKEAKGGFN